MKSTRRRFLISCGELLALGGTGLLAACQSQPAPITVTSAPAPAKPTTAAAPAASPAASPAGSPSTAPAVSPVAKPAASVGPSPSAGVVASASPSPAVAAGGVVGKPMYQMDALHTGRSPHTGGQRLAVKRTFNTNQPDLRPADALGPGPDIQSSTAIGPDGTIYATNFVGWLFALKDSPSAADRLDLAWRFRPANGSPFHCTPALARDGTVYVSFTTGSGDAARGSLFAVRAPTSGQDGQLVWQADLGPGTVQNSPTLGPDGTLYIVNVPGVLSAIDSSSGRVKWTAQTGSSETARFGQTVKVAPAVAPDGTVYTTSLTVGLHAVSPPTGSGTQGSVKWSFDFAEHLGPTPLVTSPVTAPPNRGQDGIGSGASATIGPDGTIYVGANNSNFYAIDPNGQQKWLFEAERELAGIWTTPCLSADAGTIYFGANKGGVYAVNTANGSKRWQFPVYGSIYASSALDARGLLFTGTTIEHLYAVDATQGEPIWDFDVHNEIWSAPSIRPDGTLVIADRGGIVSVIG